MHEIGCESYSNFNATENILFSSYRLEVGETLGRYFVPTDLISATSQVEYDAINLLRTGNYPEAETRYIELLSKFQEWEEKHGRRIHKGGPFHNLALSLLYQGKSPEAFTLCVH